MFLKIFQNSQENTCARASSLTKFLAAPATLLKKRLTYFPANFRKIIKSTFFTLHLRETASPFRTVRIFCCTKNKRFPLTNSSVNVTKSLMENFIFCAVFITCRLFYWTSTIACFTKWLQVWFNYSDIEITQNRDFLIFRGMLVYLRIYLIFLVDYNHQWRNFPQRYCHMF